MRKSTSTIALTQQKDPTEPNSSDSFLKKIWQKVHGQAHETVLHGGMLIDKWQQKSFYYVYYNNINKGAVSFTILPIFSSDINSREACK